MTQMVAMAALQLSAVQLRMRLRGRGRRRWAVVALNNGFICSLILIQTDTLLSHKIYYITSMTTPITFVVFVAALFFTHSLSPPCQSPSLCCLPQWHLAPPAPSLRIRRREGVGEGAQGRRCWPRRDQQWRLPLRPSSLTPSLPPPLP